MPVCKDRVVIVKVRLPVTVPVGAHAGAQEGMHAIRLFDEIQIGELLTVDDKIGLALTRAGSIRSSRPDTHTSATPPGSRCRTRKGVGA